jgi:hypothetical protein
MAASKAPEAAAGDAEIVEREAVVRAGARGGAKRRGGLRPVFLGGVGVAEIAERFGESGAELQGGAKARDGTRVIAGGGEGVAEPVVGLDGAGLVLGRRAQGGDRLGGVAAGEQQRAEQAQRLGVARLEPEHGAIERGGLVELAGAVQGHGFFELGDDGARGAATVKRLLHRGVIGAERDRLEQTTTVQTSLRKTGHRRPDKMRRPRG